MFCVLSSEYKKIILSVLETYFSESESNGDFFGVLENLVRINS